MQNLNFKLFFALLAILPFIYCTLNAESPYDLIRLLTATFISFAMLLTYWSTSLKQNTLKIQYNTPFLLLTGTLISTVISYFLSINPFLSMWGSKLLPSDSLWSVIVIFIISFVFLQSLKSAEQLKKLGLLLVFILLAQVVFGYAQLYNFDPFWWAKKKLIFGTFGLTIAYATIVGCTTPFAIYYFFNSEKKYQQILLWLLILFSANIILHSGSRSPNFANYISVFALLVYYFFKRNSKLVKIKAGLVLAAFILAFSWFAFDSHNKELKNKVERSYFSHSASTRLELTKNSFQIFKESPAFGKGPETFQISQALLQSPEMNRSYWKDPWVKAHNNVAGNLANLGFFGTFFLLSAFLYVVVQNFKLLFKAEYSAKNSLAFTFGCSYCLMFLANLTCFNIVYTQILYYTFPLAFSFLINSESSRTFNLNLRPYLKVALAAVTVIAILFLNLKAFKHWYSDTLYQEARRVKIMESSWIKSVQHLDHAIYINENEPYFYCFKSNNLAEMLLHNQSKLKPADIQITIDAIEDNIQRCVELSINREHPISMAVHSYLILYDRKLIQDSQEILATLQLSHSLAPQNPDIYLKLAAMYFSLGDTEKYLFHANRSIEVKQDYIPAYIDLFSYYYSTKNLTELQLLLDKLVKINFLNSEFIMSLPLLAEVSLQNKDSNTYNKIAEFYKSTSHLLIK